jgi:hypothetical protein
VQVYTTEVALMNLANLAASLLYKPDSTNVDYNILGIQTLVVRHHDVSGSVHPPAGCVLLFLAEARICSSGFWAASDHVKAQAKSLDSALQQRNAPLLLAVNSEAV